VCIVISVFVFGYSLVFLSRFVPHFLSVLLVFEFLTLGAILLTSSLFRGSSNCFGLYLCIIMLVCSVAEAVLGLSLLVRCSRRRGNSSTKAFRFIGL